MRFLIACLLFLSCASMWTSYETTYVEGTKKTDEFVQTLEKRGIKYRIVKHIDNIYEIQYKNTTTK